MPRRGEPLGVLISKNVALGAHLAESSIHGCGVSQNPRFSGVEIFPVYDLLGSLVRARSD
jgi:hypothetical protein